MAGAQELLEQSLTLFAHSSTQSELRRGVSTAYYSLFHLLGQDASDRWHGSLEDRLGIERAFNHNTMRAVSTAFRNGDWQHWSGHKPEVPAEIKQVAGTFVDLQLQRHSADYDNYRQWANEGAANAYFLASAAFEQWAKIREHPFAGTYLLAMLLGKGR